MQYPQDCGVSAIRFALREPDHPLARTAAAALSVPHHDAGILICQCGAPDWWRLSARKTHAVLSCGCNGSSLPLYIGPPPSERADVAMKCPRHPDSFAAAAVAVGYASPVPELGTLDAERAREIVVALACRTTDDSYIAWALRLAAPYPITGDEPWLDAIHYSRRR
jgi:hypothetical protein